MNLAVYTRLELVRILRNTRLLVFALGFPVVLYFLIAGPNRNLDDLSGSGISAPVYFMVGLAAFGTMNAVLSSGARIAAERQVGWNRQLRITPLSPWAYFRAKAATGYLVALLTIVLLYACGMALGVSLSAGRWLALTGLLLVGLVPFVPLGVLMGHLLTSDSIGPAMGGTITVLAFFGGSWFPLDGVLGDIGQALPSYWLVQASHVAVGGGGWGAKGWLVTAAWTVALSALAARAYVRDTRPA